MYFVYELVACNLGRVYIGQTSNPENRLKEHTRALVGKYHKNFKLQELFDKYNFVLELNVLQSFSAKDAANECEERLINENYGLICNISRSSGAGDLLSYHPKLTEIKITQSESAKNSWKSGFRKVNSMVGVNNPNYKHGKRSKSVLSDCVCYVCGVEKVSSVDAMCRGCFGESLKEKLSGVNNPFFGRTHTDEAKDKITKSYEARQLAGLTNSIPIIVDGVEYISMACAAKALGVTKQTVSYRVRSKNFKNYQFKK